MPNTLVTEHEATPRGEQFNTQNLFSDVQMGNTPFSIHYLTGFCLRLGSRVCLWFGSLVGVVLWVGVWLGSLVGVVLWIWVGGLWVWVGVVLGFSVGLVLLGLVKLNKQVAFP